MVELLSTVIEHLVRGEVIQIKHALQNKSSVDEVFDVYLKKSFYKTASLMANSCKVVFSCSGGGGCRKHRICCRRAWVTWGGGGRGGASLLHQGRGAAEGPRRCMVGSGHWDSPQMGVGGVWVWVCATRAP